MGWGWGWAWYDLCSVDFGIVMGLWVYEMME